MGLEIKYGTGQTPIDEDERNALIPFWVTNNQQLNLIEQENVNKAIGFFSKKRISHEKILQLSFVKKLHKKMFGDVWKWAGVFRKTEKNIGVLKTQIQANTYNLLQNVNYWIENDIFDVDELTIRCKHMLVSIHPFPNGNGRHSRLYADLLIESLGGEVFSWGINQESARENYLSSLREADKGDYHSLLKFARN